MKVHDKFDERWLNEVYKVDKRYLNSDITKKMTREHHTTTKHIMYFTINDKFIGYIEYNRTSPKKYTSLGYTRKAMVKKFFVVLFVS